jgi:hypothetical protein
MQAHEQGMPEQNKQKVTRRPKSTPEIRKGDDHLFPDPLGLEGNQIKNNRACFACCLI